MRLLLLNGPNLNRLGVREPAIYGTTTLEQIVERVTERARSQGAEVVACQSNSEGGLIDAIQEHGDACDGIVINAGALTHYGLSLRDALAGSGKPVVEVHISNVYAREPFRRQSVTAPVAVGMITGLGWRGYLYAVDFLVDYVHKAKG